MLDTLRATTPEHLLDIVDPVWKQQDAFIRWPKQSLLFAPRVTRKKGYHKFTKEQKRQLRQARIAVDGPSNGPAVMAFLLAGGERPKRLASNHGWSVHHIYDGKFPAHGATQTTHAVKDGEYFTHAGASSRFIPSPTP
ncbi:MAG: hypothetical protein O2968_14795 [Acidobacteria bacterium]|nr:hypothetical protein [Acidobacteriota bacterium]